MGALRSEQNGMRYLDIYVKTVKEDHHQDFQI